MKQIILFILLGAIVLLVIRFVPFSSGEKKLTEECRDTTVKILWLNEEYETIINEDFCRKTSDSERAALGYVASQAGSDCRWENDEPNEDYTN